MRRQLPTIVLLIGALLVSFGLQGGLDATAQGLDQTPARQVDRADYSQPVADRGRVHIQGVVVGGIGVRETLRMGERSSYLWTSIQSVGCGP